MVARLLRKTLSLDQFIVKLGSSLDSKFHFFPGSHRRCSTRLLLTRWPTVADSLRGQVGQALDRQQTEVLALHRGRSLHVALTDEPQRCILYFREALACQGTARAGKIWAHLSQLYFESYH